MYKKKRKLGRNNKNSKHMNVLTELLGLAMFFIAAFTLLALYSYNATDPSWFTATTLATKNLAGNIGSHWAALLIEFLGFGAFLASLCFIFMGVAFFRRVERKTFILSILNHVFLILSVSACLGFINNKVDYLGSKIIAGGAIGLELSTLLYRYLSLGGAILFCSFLFIMAFSLSTKISLKQIAIYTWWAVSQSALFIFALLLVVFSNIAKYSKAGLIKSYRATSRSLIYMGNEFAKIKDIELPTWPERKVEEEALAIESDTETKIESEKVPLIARLQGILKFQISESNFFQRHDPAIDSFLNKNPSPPQFQIEEGGSLDHQMDSLRPKEAPSPEKGLINIVKKAARKNSKAVRSALGSEHKYQLPPLSFLQSPPDERQSYDREELVVNSNLLEEKLADFKIKGRVVTVKPGPVVTMYEFKPGPGVKVNSIANLADDLALALSAASVRIEAPIPGRNVVGIEVPNSHRDAVYLRELISSKDFQNKNYSLPVAIGKNILGEPIIADLKKMPHLLVAGATGSGKSVFVNSLICSLLFRLNPNELKLILIDPKQLELNFYEGIPHLLLPIVTDPLKASQALKWAVGEMEERYHKISRSGMRDIDGFNSKLEKIGPEAMAELLSCSEGEIEALPKVVIVIDELADLMMSARSDVETNICRLAQKARAAGIHLCLATQRPSVDVITGLIKANLPTRISFRLSSKTDSRTIFDTMGAERLVGMGDMLFMPPGESRLLRMHGAFIEEVEMDQIADWWRDQGEPAYREDILIDEDGESAAGQIEEEEDMLFEQALEIAMSTGFVSSSMLQRRLRVGYNRAARMVEAMEARGIVGPAEGSKPRAVLADQI